MKIVHESIESIIYLDKNYFYSLIYEDQKQYRNFIKNLIKSIDEKEEFLLLYDVNKKLDFSKEVVFIESCFNLDLEEKKLTNYIQKDLVKNLSEDDINNFNELIIKINEYLKKITLDYDISLNFDNNLTINDFVKSFDVKASFEEEDFILSFVDKVKSIRMLLNKNIFIFNNLHLYFTNEEIEVLKEEMNKLEIYFINVSSFKSELCKNEKVILFDKDLCELTFNI